MTGTPPVKVARCAELLMLGLIALAATGSPMRAQSCSAGTTTGYGFFGDVYLDQHEPWGYGNGPILIKDPAPPLPGENPDYGMLSALEVKVADFNKDGVLDVVLGGNYEGVVVYYFETIGHQQWRVKQAEELEFADEVTGMGVSGCYDLDVGDVDGDTWPDIVVGRRLGCHESGFFFWKDTVFRNDPGGGTGYVHFPFTRALPIPNPTFGLPECCNEPFVPNPCPPPDPPWAAGSTLGVALGDVDKDGDLDLLTSGDDYATRYFTNSGDGHYTYQTSYLDGLNKNYRMMVLGDIDGDTDLDMVVARLNQSDLPEDPNRVYFNQWNTPQFNPLNPFLISQQPALQLPAVDHVTWTANPPCNGQSFGTVPSNSITMEVALSDLDRDQDLDLVATSYMGRNTAYLNNGAGFFGCFNSSTVPGFSMNNGQPAFIFPAVTGSWTGTESECLRGLCNAAYNNWHLTQPLLLNCGSNITYTVPGTNLNNCTGISIADVNHDRLPDVTFSYRNDLEEICRRGPVDLPYLSDNGPAVPGTYDVLFINESVVGQLAFNGCVEMIGLKDDGTGYGDLVKINTEDNAFDWVDANTNNMMQIDKQQLIWGNTLLSTGCPQIYMSSFAGGESELVIAGADEMAGLPFIVFASSTGTAGGFGFLDDMVPLTYDQLTSWLAAEGAVKESADSGYLDKEGIGRIAVSLPPEAGVQGDSVWFAAVVLGSDGTAVLVTNPLEVKVQWQ